MNKVTTPYPGVTATWYAFKCGSIFPLFSLKKSHQYTLTTPTLEGTTKHLCPICSAGLAYRIYSCEDCGHHFMLSARGLQPKRCPDCQKEFRKKSKRKWETKNRVVDAGIDLTHPPNSDCMFYLAKCLPEAAYAGKAIVDCRNCKRYIKVEAHAMIRANSSFIETGRPQL